MPTTLDPARKILGMTGDALLRRLADLYHQHHLREWTERRGWEMEEVVPRIVCSMGLV